LVPAAGALAPAFDAVRSAGDAEPVYAALGEWALDAEAEREVHAALDRWRGQRTLIVIAHRLSTVRRADTIVVFDQGRVVEQGSHAELIALGGRYAGMVRLQNTH
jgi:subfamily B ATP-binding cassette protein MsbA